MILFFSPIHTSSLSSRGTRSHLQVLHARHVGVDALNQRSVRCGVRQIHRQHLLSLGFQPFQLGTLVEILLLGQGLHEVVDAIEAVLDLREIGLDVLAGREIGRTLSYGSQFQRVCLPVVAVQLRNELVPPVVVHLGRVEVLRHVA